MHSGCHIISSVIMGLSGLYSQMGIIPVKQSEPYQSYIIDTTQLMTTSRHNISFKNKGAIITGYNQLWFTQ